MVSPRCTPAVILQNQKCRPYIRPDGIYVKSFFLFFLNVLQTTTSYLQVVLVPRLLPAPEDWLPAAGAHLVSCCMPEICSENERDLERQNLLPFNTYKTSWDTCQEELQVHLDPAGPPEGAAREPVHYLTENENELRPRTKTRSCITGPVTRPLLTKR